MRKQLLTFAPLALCACVGSAFADDSSVTLYGVLDASVMNIQHSYNFDQNAVAEANPLVNKAPNSATGMFSGGLSPSRWGIKGQEDMGGGFKAVFLLESALNIGSGSLSNAAEALTHNTSASGPGVAVDSAINGQLFSRGAYVGLSSTEFGTLTAGRNTTFFLDNIGYTDPLLGSYAFSPIGYSGAYGGGGYTDDSRVDNSLKYKISFSDFTLGLLYKFGGVAGSASAQSAYQVNGSYVAGPLGVYLGFQEFKDAFSLGNTENPVPTVADPIAGTIAATAANTKAIMLSGKYTIDFTGTTVRAGYERETYNNPSNPTQDATVNSLFGDTITSVATNAFTTQKTQNVYWIGGTQDITSAFAVLAGWYHVTENAYTANNTESCSTAHPTLCSGVTNYYSLVGDYHFSKRTDTYVGIMKDIASGGYAGGYNSTQTPQNRIVGVGLRHSF